MKGRAISIWCKAISIFWENNWEIHYSVTVLRWTNSNCHNRATKQKRNSNDGTLLGCFVFPRQKQQQYFEFCAG